MTVSADARSPSMKPAVVPVDGLARLVKLGA
jgi:hypothetical protein